MLLATVSALASVPRVIVVGPFPEHPAVVQSLEELRLLGYHAEYAAHANTALPTLLGEHDADAVLVVDESSGEIRYATSVRRADDTDEVMVSVIRPTSDGDPTELLALRAVELIHGRLAYPGVAENPATPDPGVEKVGSRSEPPSRFQLLLAPGLLANSGDLPLSTVLHARAGWTLAPFAVLGWGLLGTAATHAVSEVDLDTRPGAFGLQSRFFGAPSERWELGGGAGLGLLWWRYETSAAAPVFERTSGSRVSALPHLSVDATYLFHPRIGIEATALAGLAVPRPSEEVRTTPVDTPDATTEEVDFGSYVLVLSLGLDLRF